MLLKQALIQTCRCGSPMQFPEGEVKSSCSCGAVWEIDNGGCWFIQTIIQFAPILSNTRKRTSKRYDAYIERRNERISKRRRKAGMR